MNKSPVHAFFLGRSFAETLNEQLENALVQCLSGLGRFDAEQREWLHEFILQVQERAESSMDDTVAQPQPWHSPTADLQATLDDLRAEVARLRAELKNY